MTRLTNSWVTEPSTQFVMHLLLGAGYQAWFVGGCVRDSLLGVRVVDIDISTDATPDQVMDLAEKKQIRAIETGVEHGTVTLVIDKRAYEITTFRRDVETDGRRATVSFSTNMDEDAQRRDLTINALYADAEGQVADPTGQGLSDLTERRIRFIGDADKRIKEDYLRILRFFRFYAAFGEPEKGLDADSLSACAENIDGLSKLSAERIGSEMRKLCAVSNPAPALGAMAQIGALAMVMPGAVATAIAPLVYLEAARAPDPIRRIAALGGEDTVSRLRLSRVEAKQLALLREEIAGTRGAAELGYRHGKKTALDIMLLRAAVLNTPFSAETETEIAKGEQAKFPIVAEDLMPDLSGPALGAALRQLESDWIASDFTLGKDALLASLKRP